MGLHEFFQSKSGINFRSYFQRNYSVEKFQIPGNKYRSQLAGNLERQECIFRTTGKCNNFRSDFESSFCELGIRLSNKHSGSFVN